MSSPGKVARSHASSARKRSSIAVSFAVHSSTHPDAPLRLRRAPALALALLAIAPAAGAQLDDETRLRIERQLRMSPPRPDRDAAKFIEADRIVGEQDKSVSATGNVILRQRGATIRAD